MLTTNAENRPVYSVTGEYPESVKTIKGPKITPEDVRSFVEDPRVAGIFETNPRLCISSCVYKGDSYLEITRLYDYTLVYDYTLWQEITAIKYDDALSQNPGRIIVVRCDTCGVDYDVRFVSNEVQHKGANHVMSFDCPKGHHSEARRFWKESQEQEKSELAQLNAGVKADLDKGVREALLKMTNDDLVALGIEHGLDPTKYGFDETNSEILWLKKS